jgi:isochorismate hydrolase
LPSPKSHPNLLHREQAILVVIDMQEPFLRTIHEAERVQKSVRTLMEGANVLRIPVLCTTQNCLKLGSILPELSALLPHVSPPPIDKITFSCCGSLTFMNELSRSGRRQPGEDADGRRA